MATSNDYPMLNSPFKWVGGKSRLRKHIIALLPSHIYYLIMAGWGGELHYPQFQTWQNVPDKAIIIGTG